MSPEGRREPWRAEGPVQRVDVGPQRDEGDPRGQGPGRWRGAPEGEVCPVRALVFPKGIWGP